MASPWKISISDLFKHEINKILCFLLKRDPRLLQISVHLQQMGKSVHSEKPERFFGTSKMSQKVF
jgi:hypothetical protein